MLRELEVAYHVDGVEMIGSLIIDDRWEGPRPGVLLFGGGTGFAPFHRQRARALAELGYRVFGADYFGGGQLLEGAALDAARAAMTPNHRKALGLGAFNAFVAHPECDADRVAALGYCFGGGVAVQLAQAGAALRAVVGLHPGIGPTRTPEENANIAGVVLMCCGTADPLVPLERVIGWLQQMTDAGIDCTVELYAGVGHVFTDPEADRLGMPGISYDKRSDERSWASMLRLFSTTIGAPA
jgi:dienelactone hydrolase